MYHYVYDEFTQDKRWEKELIRIENRLADLGITGQISRLALFRDPKEMIAERVGENLTTVVAVGNDLTVRKILDVTAQKNAVLGLIPLGSPNSLARLLGVPEGLPACDILSARRIEQIDLGWVNGRNFMAGAAITEFAAEATFDGKFKIEPASSGVLEVRNLAGGLMAADTLADPRDGLLEIYIRVGLKKGWKFFKKKKYGQSVLHCRRLSIRGREPMTLIADGEKISDKRFDIRLEAQKFSVITGRKRLF